MRESGERGSALNKALGVLEAITAQSQPIGLPDLRTRIAVTPVARISEPDDRLFQALIELHFADRGLHVAPEALRFMTERLNREYWTAERAVEEVDRFAIAERARVTLPTIRRALSQARMIGDAA